MMRRAEGEGEQKNEIDVSVLLRVLIHTIEFEKDLETTVNSLNKGGPSWLLCDDDTPMDDEDAEWRSELNKADNQLSSVARNSPEGIKLRYKIDKLKKQIESKREEREQARAKYMIDHPNAVRSSVSQLTVNITGVLSGAFDPYLDLYIKTENTTLREGMVLHRPWIIVSCRSCYIYGDMDCVIRRGNCWATQCTSASISICYILFI